MFKYLGSHVSTDGRIDVEVKPRMNEVGKVLGGMKQMFRSCSLAMAWG